MARAGLLAASLAGCAASLAGCAATDTAPSRPRGAVPVPDAAAGPASLSRLPRTQYAHAVRDLFGPDVVVPSALEPDVRIDGSGAVGAAQSALSRRGVEQYERAAYAVAGQVVAEGPARGRLVRCTPTAVSDPACARSTLAPVARLAFRREPSAAELDALVATADRAAVVLDDFHEGLAYGLSAILQSPDFLYRPAFGESPSGRLSGPELATRTAFFLWDTLPDAALLDAAASGALDSDEGLGAEVDRMLEDPRARDGLRAFVSDWLGLGALSDLSKDPLVFLPASPELGPAAREETLRFVEHHVFEQDAPLSALLLSRDTFVDRRLAALYGVPAPEAEGFGPVHLPDEGERRGLLGQASVLASWAHPTSSSPTLRGKFVRETLLCQFVAPPPVSVNTAIPEPSTTSRTLRERLAEHRANAACATCHDRLDPIGLGLERFDGVGASRSLDSGAVIDPAGELDGAPFDDAAQLAERIAAHPDFHRCFVQTTLRHALGHAPGEAERDSLFALEDAFFHDGHRVKSLLRRIVLSATFRRTRPEAP